MLICRVWSVWAVWLEKCHVAIPEITEDDVERFFRHHPVLTASLLFCIVPMGMVAAITVAVYAMVLPVSALLYLLV